jgi:5-formyltetrahydrofolate cyclo-ligase
MRLSKSKSEIRKELLRNRKPNMDKNQLILENLLSLKEFKEADLVLTYVSAENEIDTHEFINKCFESGKRIAVPKTDVHNILFYEIKSLTALSPGKFGIPEPVNISEPVRITDKTLCIVPALACNKSGYRIGYGKGYYDRFLDGLNITTAALCYTKNIKEFNTEPHDIPVKLIITEGGIIYGRENRHV